MSSATVVCFCLLALAGHAYGVSLNRLIPSVSKGIRHMKIGYPVANKFKFENCGGPKDMANFTSLTVSPDPIKPPTDVKVSFAVDVLEELGGYLDLNVTMSLSVAGSWVPMPCVLDVGSCDYPDVCSYLQPIAECPEVFTKHNIPCKCPFKPGKYRLPESTFHLDAGLPACQYFVKVVLKQDERQVACAKAYFEFAQ